VRAEIQIRTSLTLAALTLVSAASAKPGDQSNRDFALDLAEIRAQDASHAAQSNPATFDPRAAGAFPEEIGALDLGGPEGRPNFAIGTGPLGGQSIAGQVQSSIRGLDAIRGGDEINIVPLPSAALGGMTLLGGLAGIRYARRRSC